jgi:hypothetical protein
MLFASLEILAIFFPKKLLSAYSEILKQIRVGSSDFDKSTISFLENNQNFTLWSFRISCSLMMLFLIIIIIHLW